MDAQCLHARVRWTLPDSTHLEDAEALVQDMRTRGNCRAHITRNKVALEAAGTPSLCASQQGNAVLVQGVARAGHSRKTTADLSFSELSSSWRA